MIRTPLRRKQELGAPKSLSLGADNMRMTPLDIFSPEAINLRFFTLADLVGHVPSSNRFIIHWTVRHRRLRWFRGKKLDRAPFTMSSKLRILVPVKRVIDYAVRLPVLSPSQMLQVSVLGLEKILEENKHFESFYFSLCCSPINSDFNCF